MGCPNSRPCPEHDQRTMRKASQDNKKLYASPRWQRFRRRILLERIWCERCTAKALPPNVLTQVCTDTGAGLAVDVHHKVDLADGGAPFDPENVEALSKSCHSRVTLARLRFRKGGRH